MKEEWAFVIYREEAAPADHENTEGKRIALLPHRNEIGGFIGGELEGLTEKPADVSFTGRRDHSAHGGTGVKFWNPVWPLLGGLQPMCQRQQRWMPFTRAR